MPLRITQKGIHYQSLEKRFGESVLPFTDPDGMALALVGIADAENETGFSNGDIPSEHTIRGFQGVTLLLDSAQKTAAILTDVFGFREVAREGSAIRRCGGRRERQRGRHLRSRQGRGSVHHIAFRAVDDVQQAQMTEKLIRTHGPTPDRTEGPQVLPLDLLPRTRRRSIRDRDRYSRICGRRADRGPRSGLGAAELSRTAS